ncbi:cysteine hydrolase [Thermosipho ferrireducens]|uniref:Cysteine hydrolase n=1 Tax=Thermosipho ferrireducens TaxID=2571116 RepID=A0ABX7S5P1_9BACT|nr:isochorismatase family cysteine hydrolase [Thermosipho ferrireducens]QTA37867.1 cysteine hydrolase [Thermosipho ferrireducens]
MKALLIIDVQNDFATPKGSLYFKGAENVIDPIKKLILKFKEKELPIFYTQDWHLQNDPEFNIWPQHCVENTPGAEIVDDIKKVLENYDKAFSIKKTRYSAFYNTNFDKMLKELNITEIDVVGLVTNICVLFTVEELRNRQIETNVYKNCVASYDKELHNLSLKLMKEVLRANIIE